MREIPETRGCSNCKYNWYPDDFPRCGICFHCIGWEEDGPEDGDYWEFDNLTHQERNRRRRIRFG